MSIIFNGNDKKAFRDPAAVFFDGRYHLFFTESIKENVFMYNFVAHSESIDLIHWTEPRVITEKDRLKNYCSPGSIVKYKDEFFICITSYPMPKPYDEQFFADDTARLYFIKTTDFKSFSKPELIYAKGSDDIEKMGRMIDPFVLVDKDNSDRYLLFFKQNGISMSESYDMKNWKFIGSADAGENACVIVKDGKYMLIHSPEDGIGIKISEDFSSWEDKGVIYLNRKCWDWANGRLTAAFAMETCGKTKYKYIVFFHGSRREFPPETHGAATLAAAYTDDFINFSYEP